MTKHRSRREATSPRSVGWSLYDPRRLAEDLKVDVELADWALERNGFFKAVRIREELIRWKERLKAERRQLTEEYESTKGKLIDINDRRIHVEDTLAGIRDLLRMPREKEKSDDD